MKALAAAVKEGGSAVISTYNTYSTYTISDTPQSLCLCGFAGFARDKISVVWDKISVVWGQNLGSSWALSPVACGSDFLVLNDNGARRDAKIGYKVCFLVVG